MEINREILIKLHLLPYEVHERYEILKKWQEHPDLIQTLLKEHYLAFLALDLDTTMASFEKKGIHVVTLLDEDYPRILEPLYRPPLVLFYQGDLKLIETKTIAVIGSRDSSPYGEKVTRMIVKDLVDNKLTIVSGLAYGIDGLAHKTAIQNQGKTIAVLGSGFYHIYPEAHQQLASIIASEHLLISEYRPDEFPSKTHFPFRNRIVSGLSQAVLVIEAKARSGTLITTDYALEQGKDIYAIPNDIFALSSVGTHHLIRQGAQLVTSAKEIIENYK